VSAGSFPLRRDSASRLRMPGTAAAGALSVTYLSLVVLIPLAAVAVAGLEDGPGGFWEAITKPQAVHALTLTLWVSLLVSVINAVFGVLIAWVLVRDDFRGKGVVNALIDLPFALPTIVAGLTLLALYGKGSPLGISVSFTQIGVALALLFVTLPFVVRSVQPVLMELDPEVEEAASSLGAKPFTVFRRIIFPAIRPAMLAGVALAFGRALGEFGSVVLISGNLPNRTEVAAVYIFGQIEVGDRQAAAAVSIVLLAASLILLSIIAAVSRRGVRH
jgi:sulfate/thiosulfate transport system permease protein